VPDAIRLSQSGEFETYNFNIQVKDLYPCLKLGRHHLITGLKAFSVASNFKRTLYDRNDPAFVLMPTSVCA